MKWMVVQTKSNCENKASKNLMRQGFSVFFPKIKKNVSRFNKFYSTIKPLFPGYIFVSIIENKSWTPIESTYGVFKILKMRNYLYHLPPEVFENIKMRCDNNGLVDNYQKYARGESVKYFKNDKIALDAIFEEEIDEKRSFIFINFLNQKVKARVETKNLEVLA